MKKLIFPLLFISVNLGAFAQFDQSCLPEGITLTIQNEIDNFKTHYPRCTKIMGDLNINGSPVFNLDSLDNIRYVGGDINIEIAHNLQNIRGLSNLRSVGGDFSISDARVLKSLNGLERLDTIHGEFAVGYSDSLIDFSGCENLKYLDELYIYNNISLLNINGFDGLKKISSDCIIKINSSLSEIYGFKNLKSIDGNLEIEWNPLLENINAFNKLKRISGRLNITKNHSLELIEGFDSLRIIDNFLSISECDSLRIISGFRNLDSINGYFDIRLCYSLLDLRGFESLSTTHMLSVRFNSSLKELVGLKRLTSVNGELSIYGNDSLTSIVEIDSVDGSSLTSINIHDNNQLSICNVQGVCQFLSNPHGRVTIYNNAQGCSSSSEIAEGCGIIMPCLPYGDYIFTTQADIDSFPYDYQDCTQLKGNIRIMGKDIKNLHGLNGITWMNELGVFDTDSLTTLEGLETLEEIDWRMTIIHNKSLQNLHGIENLTLVGNHIHIYRNDTLNSLSGLDQLELEQMEGRMSIFENKELSFCSTPSICAYLENSEADISIHDNKEGCNSPEEVQGSCWVSIDEHWVLSELKVQPNPFSTSTSISYNLPQPSTMCITIFNHLGQQVDFIQQSQSQGKQQITWDATGQPSGIYYFRLEAGEQVATGKLLLVR